MDAPRHRVLDWIIARAGGRARVKMIVALASVLALGGADMGAIGAMSEPMQKGLAISKTQIGLILGGALLASAAGSLPFGWLVDRVNRTRLLSWAALAWAAAMALNACATGFIFLLIGQLVLGVLLASATPSVASLVGDAFPENERGKIFGNVLAGELVGTAVGYLGAGALAAFSWRAGFAALAVPALVLGFSLRHLKEPARGQRGVLAPGATSVKTEADVREGDDGGEGRTELRDVQKLAREKHLQQRARLLIDSRPREKSMWWALKYVVRIPSNVVLVIASSLGYFFFAGIRTFGAQYVQARYDLTQPWSLILLAVLGTGALAGVSVSGRLADRLVKNGHESGRVLVAAVAYAAAALLLLPALLMSSMWAAFGFFAAAGTFLGAANPPMDAGRLDYMHPDLFGRAEAVRALLREAAEAAAPLTVAFLADHVFGGRVSGGLHAALLIMLIPLGLGALIAFLGIRTYPRDVATAEENIRRTMKVADDETAA